MTRETKAGNARRGEAPGARELDAARFPALARFFRGYLHQDVGEVYGGAAAAARAFGRDASPAEADEVAAEWASFAREAAALSLGEVGRAMVERMGSAWVPASRRDLEALGRALVGARASNVRRAPSRPCGNG